MKTDQQVRMAVKRIFGGKNAIVKRNGEIHIRDIMPNTNIYAWYLLGFNGADGYIEDILFHYDGSLNYSLKKSR
jgi:hypothetical protein